MTRDELVIAAREKGASFSDKQIKRWHKAGVIPAPVRNKNWIEPGSNYEYPSGTLESLLIISAAPSKNRRSLDQLRFYVWLNGGKINVEKLRDAILKEIDQLQKFITRYKDVVSITEKLSSMRPKWLKIQGTNTEDVLAAVNVLLNVISHREDDRIWEESERGPNSTANIADRLLGINALRALEPAHHGETAKSMFEDMKKFLNIKALRKAITEGVVEDFERAKSDIPLLMMVFEFFGEYLVIDNKNPFNFASRVFKYFHFQFPQIAVASLFVSYHDENISHSAKELINFLKEDEERIKLMTAFIKHMRMHPRLKRVKNWISNLETYDITTKAELSNHADKFISENPKITVAFQWYESLNS